VRREISCRQPATNGEWDSIYRTVGLGAVMMAGESCSSSSQSVLEVYDAVAKAALVQQLELGMDAGG
jgi:hypothetical protein